MHPTSAAPDLPELLRRLVPPHAVIHVGAGAGRGPLHRWRAWSVPQALLVEADPARTGWTATELERHPGWRLRHATLDAGEASRWYFEASNPDEDGLIAPEQIAALWPNLRRKAGAERRTETLEALLARDDCRDIAQADTCWAIVDCLPALPILRGAGAALSRWSVIWARVLLQPVAGGEAGATLDELAAFLRDGGYRCVHVGEENHPALGLALFVRDWKTALAPRVEALQAGQAGLTRELAAAAQQLSACGEQRDALENELAALRQLAATRAAQVEAIKAARDEQAAQAAVQSAQAAQATAEAAALATRHAARGDEIAAQAAALALRQGEAEALQTQLRLLGEQQERLGRHAAALQARVETLTEQNSAQSGERRRLDDEAGELRARCLALRDEVESLARERDLSAGHAAEHAEQMEALRAELLQARSNLTAQEAEIVEQHRRQSLLNEEIVRAEAQISLITDVLLRDPGL